MSPAGRRLNSYDALKLSAMLWMSIDHIGYFLVTDEEVWRLAGRLAMPIFCFLGGYNRQYRFSSHILWVAIAISVVDITRGHFYQQNILWTMLAIRALLGHTPESLWTRFPALPIIGCVLWFIPTNLIADYGTLGLLWALLGAQVAQYPRRYGIITAYAASALALTLFVTWDVFVTHVSYGIVATLALTLMTARLMRFELTPWQTRPGYETAALWLSRHALSYYGIHLIVVMGIGMALGITP